MTTQNLSDAVKAVLSKVYSNIRVPQETRKKSQKQPKFTFKATRKRRTKILESQQKERIYKYQSRNEGKNNKD